MRKTAALNYLSIILLLGVYLGIKIFASLNFAYVLFPSWGLVYIFSKRLPAKLALLIPGLSVLSFYSLFFNPVSIPWKASLIIVSTILQLQAWASLYQKNSVAALNEFERKIINCSFIGILIPMYLALSGFTLRYRSYENDKLSLLLYALLALLFLESTSRKPVNKLLTRNSNIIEKCIPIVALLFLMASSLLVAHISTGSFYSFIPQTVRYIKRHNPQFKKREEKRLEKDQKNEIAQREVGYSNETKLNSSFSLKKNFSKVAVSLEVKKGNKLLNSDKIYLRCNQFSKFENKKWHSQKFYRSIQGDYFKSDKTGWINYRKPKKQNQLEYAVTLHHKNLTMIPQIGEPYAFKVPKAKIGNRRAQVKHSGLITLQIKADAPLTTKEIRFPETYIYSNSYKPKTKLEKRIQTLARSITENSPTVEDKIIELQNYLHRYCKYSLKVENSYNMHPLENFLFHEKKGHCVLFATAYCLMLRSIGIPAIVCSGYFGGDFKEDRKEYLFYSGNAHTWVEIPVNYKRDYIIADPTPRVMLPDSPSKNKPDKFETKSFKDYLTETKKIWVNAKLKDIYTILSIISLIPFLLFWKWKLLKSLIPEEKMNSHT
ncbi:MAG: transglutaminase-like domain-containing protein [Lentisphaerales bacterium]|nr:transglutaminase-like domain-containing protein [Lentisphaerales bacterium]